LSLLWYIKQNDKNEIIVLSISFYRKNLNHSTQNIYYIKKIDITNTNNSGFFKYCFVSIYIYFFSLCKISCGKKHAFVFFYILLLAPIGFALTNAFRFLDVQNVAYFAIFFFKSVLYSYKKLEIKSKFDFHTN
jgi:hypothetical protein